MRWCGITYTIVLLFAAVADSAPPSKKHVRRSQSFTNEGLCGNVGESCVGEDLACCDGSVCLTTDDEQNICLPIKKDLSSINEDVNPQFGEGGFEKKRLGDLEFGVVRGTRGNNRKLSNGGVDLPSVVTRTE